jgi:tyrosine decarboxylase
MFYLKDRKVITMKNDLNLKALFVGSKSENGYLFKELLGGLIDDHMGWRQNYMPQDPSLITEDEKDSESYKATVRRVKNVLNDFSTKMRTHCVPWHTAGRYWGQMNSETLMPSIVAYSAAMLWNGNNCAYESSPATSQMEEDVGRDFATLMGYKDGWGHLTSGGTSANIEGLWYARNVKSIPLALKEVLPETVAGKSEWELLNMPTRDMLDIVEAHMDKIDDIKAHSARSGKNIQKLGMWLVPQTKHYSWLKAADVVGVGLDHVVAVPVDERYRMKVDALEQTIRDLAAKHIPVLGVVAVVGSTEEGAIDHIDQIVALRKKLMKDGIYFYLHIDAAYGSYARSLFLDENNNFIPYADLMNVLAEHHVFNRKDVYVEEDVYNAYKAMDEAESVTLDPHKMGYVPYAAGGISIKWKSMRELIGYFATYVLEKGSKAPSLLGAYIMEGSKAGATAAGVWTAHRVLPLNVTGYGRLIGASIEGAQNFYNLVKGLSFQVNGKNITVHALTKPDFNMVDFVFEEEGASLEANNALNKAFFQVTSSGIDSLYGEPFITSHTDFAIADYGDSPFKFVHEELGYSREEWEKNGKVTVLRACALSPYMNDPKAFAYFGEEIRKAMEAGLKKVVK